jgi:hypothetical protein
MSDIQQFETKQDFINYYNEHKDLEDLKTKELNLKFKVKDHKIIRNKGKLAFRKIKSTNDSDESNDTQETKENIDKQVDLFKTITELKEINADILKKLDNVLKMCDKILDNMDD